jgi:hypothetical protein
MRKSEAALLSAYIYNNYVRLENQVKILQSNVMFRRIDPVDCIELMLATQELETFKEVTKHIRILLKLDESGCFDDYPEK